MLWTLIVLLQAVIDLVLLGVVLLVWKHRESNSGGFDDRVRHELEVMGTKSMEWEAHVKLSRDRMEGQLKSLTRICEQANRILARSHSVASFSPSSEECELKAVASFDNDPVPDSHPETPAPTLAQAYAPAPAPSAPPIKVEAAPPTFAATHSLAQAYASTRTAPEEIPAAPVDEKREDRIPTLREIEKTNHRLKSDLSLDLRMLLKDQLA